MHAGASAALLFAGFETSIGKAHGSNRNEIQGLVMGSRVVFTNEVKWRLRLPLQPQSRGAQKLFRSRVRLWEVHRFTGSVTTNAEARLAVGGVASVYSIKDRQPNDVTCPTP